MTRASRRIGCLFATAVIAVLPGTPAQAYYHYIHYVTRNSPFSPVPEKLNLSALPNHTVTFFASDAGPAAYAPNDSFGSVLSQVRQAAAAWNSVDASDLRVAFGGLEPEGQTSNAPAGDVIFTDLPPGVLGLGSPLSATTPVGGADGQFFPIVRSTVVLTRDTRAAPGPSYLEGFYTTAVHEIGHALGLQHTFTSSAMAQDVVRNTSRARPLDADDYAALLVLYGKAGWAANYGAISGRVFSNGQPVALASVVAINPTGPAISALTNPDGTYRIDGLPPGSYLLYVHPLPPDADIKGPFNNDGEQIPQSTPFETLFYPGTRDPQAASTITLGQGATETGKDFSVQPRGAVPMYDIVTYGYLDPVTRNYNFTGPNWVSPAFVDVTQGQVQVVARANPPVATPVPQSVTILGGWGNATIIPYASPLALALRFYVPAAPGAGPRHLVFNTGDDMYVLPDAVTLVQKSPPSIASVTANSDGTVTVTGAGFGLDSRVFFDGLEARLRTPFTGTDAQGSLTVAPPPGASGQVATLTVFNSDGQNSMFLQSQNPPTYTYPTNDAPQINVTPTLLPAGVNAMVDITGVNTRFVDGQVTVGFGSGDITVRRVWVLSPTHLVANVVLAPNAASGLSEISVVSGSQVISLAAAFQTQAPNSRLPFIALPITSADQASVYSGTVVSLYGVNLQQSPANVQLTLNDIPVHIQYVSATQINFEVPSSFPVGPAILKLNNGSENAFPVVVQIAPPPPVVAAITNAANAALAASDSVSAGDILNVLVTNVDPNVAGNLDRVRVTVSGVDMQVLEITSAPRGAVDVQFLLKQSFGGAQVPVAVSVDGSFSAPIPITVR